MFGAHHAVDELDGGFLLEAEAVADAVAGIDQDAEAQRQVALGGELHDGLRLLVFEDLEVVLGQVGDEAALLVGDGEEHVDAGDVDLDARRLVGLDGGCCTTTGWAGCWTTGFCSAAHTPAPRAAEAARKAQDFIWTNYNAAQGRAMLQGAT